MHNNLVSRARGFQVLDMHRSPFLAPDMQQFALVYIGIGRRGASWLGRSTPDRAVRVRDLAGDIIALCSWTIHLTLTVPLSTQMYNCVPVNLMLGITLRWTSIPSKGEQKNSQSLHATETGLSSGLVSNLAHMQTLPLHWHIPPKACVYTKKIQLTRSIFHSMRRV